ncbi:unnamed protein product, partial [Symbiodinium necroappetens]
SQSMDVEGNKQYRGKLYILNDAAAWQEAGTGHACGAQRSGMRQQTVRSVVGTGQQRRLQFKDEDSEGLEPAFLQEDNTEHAFFKESRGQVLHDRPVFAQDVYQLQGEGAQKTIIVWEDEEDQKDWAWGSERDCGALPSRPMPPKAKRVAKRPAARAQPEEDPEAATGSQGTLPKADPAASAKRSRVCRVKEEREEWWAGRSLQQLEQCFKKELALFLKTSYVDPDRIPRRKLVYFRRNYLEVPGLRKGCERIIEEINSKANERLRKIVPDAQTWQDLLEKEMLADYLLGGLAETRGSLTLRQLPFPSSFGEKPPQKDLPVGLAMKLRAGLEDWFYDDLRKWVALAEQSLGAAQLSRLLFGDEADHVEVKVQGLGFSVSFVLPESTSLQELAELADEHLLMKWQEKRQREGQNPGSWLIEVVDGWRRKRACEVLQKVLDATCPAHADRQVVQRIRAIETLCKGRLDAGLQHLPSLVDLKLNGGGISENDACRIHRECKSLFPCTRIDSGFHGDGLGLENGPDTEYLESAPGVATVGVLPAPEDQLYLGHMDDPVGADIVVKLSWIKLWDAELRIEVVAHVPKDWKRPYTLVRHELRESFHSAEEQRNLSDLQSLKDLSFIFQIVKGVFLFATHSLTERYLAEDVYEVLGMLELDESLPPEKRMPHRQDMNNSKLEFNNAQRAAIGSADFCTTGAMQCSRALALLTWALLPASVASSFFSPSLRIPQPWHPGLARVKGPDGRLSLVRKVQEPLVQAAGEAGQRCPCPAEVTRLVLHPLRLSIQNLQGPASRRHPPRKLPRVKKPMPAARHSEDMDVLETSIAGRSAVEEMAGASNIHTCGVSRRWQAALHLLAKEAMTTPTETRSLNMVLAVLVKAGRWHQAWQVFLEMKTKVQINAITYNTALSSCVQGACWQSALQLLWTMASSHVLANEISINTTITACEKAGHWSVAMQLLADMPQAELEADTISYNASISACGRGSRWDVSLQLLSEMSGRQLRANTISYNAAISAAEKAGKWQTALQLLFDMPSRAILPDRISFNSAISACEKGGQWDVALLLLHGMGIASIAANLVSFNAAISACEKAGQWDKALALLFGLSTADLLPDSISYNAAISACATSSEWQLALFLLTAMPRAMVRASEISFSAAIHGCAWRGSEQWQTALRLLSGMADGQCSANEVTIGSAISACEKGLQWQIAQQLLTKVLVWSLRCNYVHIAATISASEKGEEWRLALELLAAMLRAPLRPNDVSVNAAISAVGKVGEWQAALYLLAGLGHAQTGADEISHSSTISACEKGSMWPKALQRLSAMSQSRFLPNEICFNGAISAGEKAGCWKSSLHLLYQMDRTRIGASDISYNAAISTCERKVRRRSDGWHGSRRFTMDCQ